MPTGGPSPRSRASGGPERWLGGAPQRYSGAMHRLGFLLAPMVLASPVVALLHDGHVGDGHAQDGHAQGGERDHASAPISVALTVTDAARALIEAVEAHPPRVPQTYVHGFDDPRRRTIDYFPALVREDQRGLRLGLMALEPRRATHRLLREVLSGEGYLRVQAIRSLETTLGVLTTDTSFTRIPDAYTVQFFGEPSEASPWALKFEGHHLSINATVAEGEFRGTPLFLGASPAEVQTGSDAGVRVLGPQEDLARALLASLDEEQRRRAVDASFQASDAIPLGPLRAPGEPRGLSAGAMTPAQRALLLRWIESFAVNLRPEFARAELARVEEAGVEELTFAWRGATEPGAPFACTVQGPTVLIQLEGVEDTPGDGANHLHALWRDPERDFGLDLLTRHHAEEHAGDR